MGYTVRGGGGRGGGGGLCGIRVRGALSRVHCQGHRARGILWGVHYEGLCA